ncbi:hypothetical protein SRHO_G00188780 [Serrasalmus rhombeus]
MSLFLRSVCVLPTKRKKRGKGNKHPKKELSGADADTDSEESLSDSDWSACSQEVRLPVRYTAGELKKFLSVTNGYRSVQWASCRDVEERFFLLQARITQQSATLLDAELSLGELHEALQGMENGRAPGIDGLPVEFYKAFWSVLGQDVLEVVPVSVQEGTFLLAVEELS